MIGFGLRVCGAALGLSLCCSASACSHPPAPETLAAPTVSSNAAPAVDFYALSAKTLEGQPAPFNPYRGKVALVVNVASECGYTPQYAGLQRLYAKYQPRGFVVLGFPSNDFGRQEPGSPQEIRAFCSSKYRVHFPMFEKLQTKPGAGQSPIYAELQRATGTLPAWNFGKYLISRAGKVLLFFPSDAEPESDAVVHAVEAALDGQAS